MLTHSEPKGFIAELRMIVQRGREVWHLVPGRHKAMLGTATLVMALTSLCNTSLPLLLGRLVDAIKQGTEQGQGRQVLYSLAARFLVLIGIAYVLREALNVLRRWLVENTCTRI